MATSQQQQYEILLNQQILSSKELAKQNYDAKYSGSKVILKVNDRISFKSNLEDSLKNNKVKFTTQKISGSSFDATIINFDGGKRLTVQYKPAGDAKVTTAQQELGSAHIFTQALVRNVKYDSPEDILKKEGDELKRIFKIPSNKEFTFSEWLISFYYQQKVLLEKYGSPKFSRFDRDGGFMEYITKLINVKFGISKKDTWDPADVWAVEGSESAIEKQINEEMKKFPNHSELEKQYSNNPNLLEDKIRLGIIKLNAVLIDLLKKEKVIGISLKLTDKNASIEEVNVQVVNALVKDNKLLIDTVSSPFKVNPSQDFTCKFDIPVGKNTFTQDVLIQIEDEDNTQYKFQIKANSSESTTGSNLKFEVTIRGKGKARAGKVPVDILDKLIKKTSLTNQSVDRFVNDYRQYPRNSSDFATGLDEYKMIYDSLTAKRISFGVDKETFIKNISQSFANKNGAVVTNATCKLMALNFIYMLLCQMTEEQMKSVLTDMAFLAQKKNTRKFDTFGPFIKIS